MYTRDHKIAKNFNLEYIRNPSVIKLKLLGSQLYRYYLLLFLTDQIYFNAICKVKYLNIK